MDPFTKKLKFLLTKSPKLGRKANGFLCIKFFAATQTVGIFMMDWLKLGTEEITIFLNAKVSEVGQINFN